MPNFGDETFEGAPVVASECRTRDRRQAVALSIRTSKSADTDGTSRETIRLAFVIHWSLRRIPGSDLISCDEAQV